MTPSDIHVIIRYRAKPQYEETALRELADLVAVVRAAEPDCTGITIVRHEKDPGEIMLIETWTSRDAYVGPHLRTPHITAFRERAGAFMAGPPDISFWHATTAV